jgi:hypothetical protein
MTRKILMVGSLLLSTLAGPTVSPASAQQGSPGANRDYQRLVHDYCEAVIASGDLPTLNYGECESFNVVSDNGFKTHFCDALREGAGATLEDYGFTSYSDCIRNLQL